MKKIILPFFALALFITACKKDKNDAIPVGPSQDEVLHMNEIQVVASHNSYRKMTTDTVYSFLLSVAALIPPEYDPVTLDYDHLPLADQMNNYNVRGLEIDVYNDPLGGAFSNRLINSYVGLDTASNIPELDQPGFKVLHIKDVDYNTHHYTFRSALTAIRNWSITHPNHIPLFINVESKIDSPADDPTLAGLGFQPPPVYDLAAADAMDVEIRDVFGQQLPGVFTPDKLRGSLSTLNEAALQKKWPLLKDCRGKVVFIMEGNCVPFYVQNHPSLQGRAMFVYANPGSDEAAFVKFNDARADSALIRQNALLGYIIRSRCDSGTLEARNGDYTAMNAAFESGAHICSTDYYKADARAGQPGWSNYKVALPGGVKARKNPVTAAGIDVENTISD
jgi:hypothetical protein